MPLRIYVTLNGSFKIQLNKMKVNVILEQDEDDIWIVECPTIPGCISQGETKEKALNNIKDAIITCLDVRVELGYPLIVRS
jgi:predicted RNase H-like HicB family nuclease